MGGGHGKRAAAEEDGASAPARDDQVTAAADALYSGPLAEFVAERKRLSLGLKKAGEAGAAAEVAALGKPSVSAWVVNRLHRDEADEMAALFEAGGRMRGGDVAAGRDQRAVLNRLTKRAGDILRDGGHAASPAMLRRVTTTLQALSALGTFDPDPPGQLVEDRDPPGFDLLAGVPMAPREKDEPAPRAPKPVPKPDAAAAPVVDAAERRRRQRLEAQRKLLEQKATQAARRVDARADTAAEIRADLDRAEATAERLRAALAEADESLAEARAAAEEIAVALADIDAGADPAGDHGES